MYTNPLINNSRKNNIPSLIENRLVFDAQQPSKPEVQTRTLDIVQNRPSPEALETGVIDVEKKLKENKTALEKGLAV